MLLIRRSLHKTNSTPVSGGTVEVASYLDLGYAPPVVNLQSTIITQPGTYTIFDTGSGIKWGGTVLPALANLNDKIDVKVPAGYAVQATYVDSTGLKVKVVVRKANTI